MGVLGDKVAIVTVPGKGFAVRSMTGNLSFQIEHHLFPDLPSKNSSSATA